VFNIRDFIQGLNKYGGPNQTNLFKVTFTQQNINDISTMPNRDLVFFCRAINVPGINLGVTEYRPLGYGKPQYMPMTMQSDDMNCVFILDSDHRVIDFFHQWTKKIINYDVSGGYRTGRAGDPLHIPYEINYKSNYVEEMTIEYYGKSNSTKVPTYTIFCSDVYPTQVSSLSLSWDPNAGSANLSVNFSYSSIRFEHNQIDRPVPIGPGEPLTDQGRSLPDFSTGLRYPTGAPYKPNPNS
jgi:hypothetical protein